MGTEPDLVGREMEQETDRALLGEALARLSPRERHIMQMRFGLGGRREQTQREVADALGISQSYISRLEKRIIRRLRVEMSAKM
jgi:RNA polymerase sporulation-specific sigma factor